MLHPGFILYTRQAIMFYSLKYFIGQSVSLETLQADIAGFGYERGTSACHEGLYAVRGSILDIFPANFDSPIRIDLDDDKIRAIYSFNLLTAKNIWEHKAVIILPARSKRGQRAAKNEGGFTSVMPLNNFVDIERGDYVVHNMHGIGKFLGFQEINIDINKVEHFVIEYQGGDKLFVPRRDLHLVQKYIGFSKRPPRLFKLGSREWEKVRRTIEKRLQRLAAELLHVQALRASLRGHPFSADVPWQESFEKKFPYTETPDQLKSTSEVKADMESVQPMDRLLCGDVGYGKTEVAMRAAFKAVMDGKQVAVLVPTTVLAEQHYFNFSKRMQDYPVRIGMLSRFRSKAEQSMIVKEAVAGKIDILIGTHRLLSKDVSFKELGLIIIDEEQRFGVQAKERLKHMKMLADVLTLTATPIPRTLYMALAGCRDMSVISTPPQNRIPVSTHLIGFDEEIIGDAIRKELSRGGQVFFLHNHIEDITPIAAIIRRLVPKARLAVGHGQMPGRELESIMIKFLKGEVDVLVCTTIIESGIDIPNANTLIVNRAERFGLSDLHQLRGRVGRMDVKAFAYFVVPDNLLLSSIAKRRLKALEKFTDLGAGFQIAFEDLQIRGAGNLLGEQQHGYISSIGFDLYCRMLKESVENIKKEMGKVNAISKSI
ncbi:MAG: transcription-repair coupling factor [Candidatus Omnitrophica bacterium]|nr:transcription-repair coupling factor [Candidatus Omnitrophota bacterium]